MKTKKSLSRDCRARRIAGTIVMFLIGVIEAAGVLLVGVAGVILKAVSVLMIAAAGLLFFLTQFSGWNALSVILTAAAMFWLPELAGVLLAGLVLLQRKIADVCLY